MPENSEWKFTQKDASHKHNEFNVLQSVNISKRDPSVYLELWPDHFQKIFGFGFKFHSIPLLSRNFQEAQLRQSI